MFEVKFKPSMVRLKTQAKQTSGKCSNLLLNIVDLTPIKISGSSTNQVPDIIKELTQSWKHQNCYKRIFNLENFST